MSLLQTLRMGCMVKKWNDPKDITFAKNLALLPLIEYSILMTCKNFES